ncbi:MAG: ABC transporter permease [Cyanobacteria bacterium]|nr:ABC transporter permease [Cyanobacteriota bacterium]MDW8202605.1 ABC transporter permease [Cyanobacteriota bacterium SKYGB_h_bin112]
MHPKESLQMAIKTLAANKLRSTLTMLGIIIGNASVIAMIGIGEAGQRFINRSLESLGPNVLFVIPGNPDTQRITFNVPKTLVLADAEAIATQVPSVVEVAAEFNSRELITVGNRNIFVNTIGTTPGFLKVRSFEVAKGRFISDLDLRRNNQTAVLGAELAQRLFANQNPVGRQIRIKNTSFTVIGVLESKGAGPGINYDETVLVPVTTLSNRIVGRTSPYGIELTYIAMSAKNSESVRAAKFQVENLLRLRHKITTEDDFTIRTQKDLMEIAGTITGALTTMLAAIAGISLLVGGIGIMNIMLVSVTERTQEIGLRKAIGASRQDILVQFLIEAVILSATGGVIGIALGVGGTVLVGVFTPLDAIIPVGAVVTAITVSGAIGLFFGVVPARQAASLDPIVALRTA